MPKEKEQENTANFDAFIGKYRCESSPNIALDHNEIYELEIKN
ncbi:MAG: hypothetical protein WCJ84_04830 [Candidatus Peregrinibacteria bacterium]